MILVSDTSASEIRLNGKHGNAARRSAIRTRWPRSPRPRVWLRQFNKTKTLNKRSGTSYGLKHVAEEDIGYITNGVFIAAAIAEGFRVKRCSDNSPNGRLNISKAARGRGWRSGSQSSSFDKPYEERLAAIGEKP
jgi:hypothetical protein